jgi:hypothetical protein
MDVTVQNCSVSFVVRGRWIADRRTIADIGAAVASEVASELGLQTESAHWTVPAIVERLQVSLNASSDAASIRVSPTAVVSALRRAAGSGPGGVPKLGPRDTTGRQSLPLASIAVSATDGEDVTSTIGTSIANQMPDAYPARTPRERVRVHSDPPNAYFGPTAVHSVEVPTQSSGVPDGLPSKLLKNHGMNHSPPDAPRDADRSAASENNAKRPEPQRDERPRRVRLRTLLPWIVRAPLDRLGVSDLIESSLRSPSTPDPSAFWWLFAQGTFPPRSPGWPSDPTLDEVARVFSNRENDPTPWELADLSPANGVAELVASINRIVERSNGSTSTSTLSLDCCSDAEVATVVNQALRIGILLAAADVLEPSTRPEVLLGEYLDLPADAIRENDTWTITPGLGGRYSRIKGLGEIGAYDLPG